MSDNLREALADTIWWGDPKNPATWCWCDDFCDGKDYGCAAARAALAAPDEGRAERIERAARRLMDTVDGIMAGNLILTAGPSIPTLRQELRDALAAPASPPSPAPEAAPCQVKSGHETRRGTCFGCGAIVEPTLCLCGAMHVGTYCWPCHHKNVGPDRCAAPFCPEHGFPATERWLKERAPAPSSPAKEEP